MKISDLLFGLVAIGSLAIAIWQIMLYLSLANGLNADSGMKHLAAAIIAGVVAIGSVVAYLMRHPHVEEEIHVTK